MVETTPSSNAAEPAASGPIQPSPASADEQKKPSASLLGALLNPGVEPMLQAQADLLVGVETQLIPWLRRCQDALTDAQTLAASLRASADPVEFVAAQQEWVLGAVRRMTTDAAEYQTAVHRRLTNTWFPLVAHKMERSVSDVAAATRAAGKPPRMA